MSRIALVSNFQLACGNTLVAPLCGETLDPGHTPKPTIGRQSSMHAKIAICALAIVSGRISTEAVLQWTTNNNEITITGGGTSMEADLYIPATITGLPVTAIGPSAFYGDGGIANVVIPDSVRLIDTTAFAYCGQLQTMTLGSGLTNLGYHWVASSSRLRSISVAGANPALESSGGVLFDKGQQTLILCPPQQGGDYAVPSTIKRIGPGAFDHAAITGVSLPASVTDVETGAFYACTALRSVTLNEGLQRIANLGFYGCTALTRIAIPDSVTNIYGAFDSCAGLTNAILGTNLVEIGGAFRLCERLQSITVPEKVTDLGDSTFGGCKQLSQVVLPLGLARIGSGTFSQCAMTNLALPNGLRTIERYAFEFCTRLEISTVPSTVTNIGQFAFRECYSIGHLEVPDSVLRLGESVFNHCINLTSVAIGKGLNTIDLTPFDACGSLTDISVDPQNANFSSLDGVLFDKNKTQLVCFPCGRTEAYRVPTGVRDIAYWAFAGCKLDSVTLPDTVTNICTGAFNSSSLTSIWFEGNGPTVGYYALSGAIKATVFYFPQTSGWTTTLDSRPTLLWNARLGTPSLSGANLSCSISGSSNLTVIVESQDGLGGNWTARQTNTLYNGVDWFNDSTWTKSVERFYRLRAP